MPPKKQKQQKMALADFFAETTSGSWADEMENLPTAPAPRESTGPRRGEPGYLDSMPDRSARTFPGAPPPREDVPLPTAPPFTAFIGNLTYETDEVQLRGFFNDLQPVSVRLVKDSTQKSKGFGYVEFPKLDGLKEALTRSGQQLGGRTIRVNVADSQPNPRREVQLSAADSASEWRRSGPLPVRDPPSFGSSRKGSFYNNSSSAAGGEPAPERDWASARGAKFVPSPSMPSTAHGVGFSRETSGGDRGRGEREPTAADGAEQWRSSKPMVPVQPQQGGQGQQGGRDAPPHKALGPADTESTWSRGTKIRQPSGRGAEGASGTAAATAPAQPSPADERDWRSSRNTSAAPSVETSPKLPASRPKLNLLPRSNTADSPSSTPTATTSKASPFGAARPVDSASKDAAAAAKIASRDEARRKEEQQKAAAAAAAKEKEKEGNIATTAGGKEKISLDNNNSNPTKGGPRDGGRGGRGGLQGQGHQGPKRVHPSRLNGHQQEKKDESSTAVQASSPSSPAAATVNTIANSTESTSITGPDADGFEGVSRGAKGGRLIQEKAAQQKAAEEKKKKDAKASGFSFAAAAEMMNDNDDGEQVEEVTEEVGKMKV